MPANCTSRGYLDVLLCLTRTLVAAVALSAPAFGQATDPRVAFTDALGQFSLALGGTYGDEGSRIRSSLDSLDRALEQWDAVIRAYEAGMAAEIGTAAPPLAARMHMALGAVYLDRGRTEDALRELTTASRLDATRPEVLTLLGLAHSQSANSTAATNAFRQAAALDPADTVRAYVLARHLLKFGAIEEAKHAFGRVQESLAVRSDANRQAAAVAPEVRVKPDTTSPFISPGLVPETSGVEPFFAPALYAEGFSQLQRGNYEKALTEFRSAVTRDPLAAGPGVESGAIARAAAAFRDGAVQPAAEHLKVALELAPESAEAHRLLGSVYVADDLSDEGIDELETAVRLRPSDERARLAQAAAFTKIERYAEASRTLQQAITALPSSGRARYDLGLVYQRQGLFAEALGAFEEALRLKPLIGLNGLYKTMGNLRRARQDFDGAIEVFARRVDLVPNSAEAHQELGDVYFRQGRHDEALAEFGVALLLDPTRAEASAAIAQIHLRDGRYAEAADVARHTVTLAPAHKEARYVLATSLMRLGKTDEGRQELATFERLQSEATAARFRELELNGLRRDAAVSSANGDFAKAAELLRKAVLAEQDSSSLHLDLGVALLKAGQPAEAVEHLTTAVTLRAHFDVHAYLAEAYAALGRVEDSERERALYAQQRQEAIRQAGTGR